MSISDIKMQLLELYDADISESLISSVTDKVSEDVKEWQNRPLEPIVFFDCIVIKVRQKKRIIPFVKSSTMNYNKSIFSHDNIICII